jgi:hypothetical protein
VQDCAIAGSAHPDAMAAAPIANPRLMIMPSPKTMLSFHSIVSTAGFSVQGFCRGMAQN